MADIPASDMIELVNPANGLTFKVTPRQANGVYAGFSAPAGAGIPTDEHDDTDNPVDASTLEE